MLLEKDSFVKCPHHFSTHMLWQTVHMILKKYIFFIIKFIQDIKKTPKQI